MFLIFRFAEQRTAIFANINCQHRISRFRFYNGLFLF